MKSKALPRYFLPFSLVLLAGVAACSMGPYVKENVTPSAQLDTQARTAPAPEYQIQVGDEIEIKFLYNPEMNERLPVRPDGRISLQFVKEILVVGQTPRELGDLHTQKYAAELKRPDVTVIVRSFGAQKVFVDGEVSRP